MDDLRLTKREWEIVDKQCYSCRWWDEANGCSFPKVLDKLSQPECLVKEI